MSAQRQAQKLSEQARNVLNPSREHWLKIQIARLESESYRAKASVRHLIKSFKRDDVIIAKLRDELAGVQS